MIDEGETESRRVALGIDVGGSTIKAGAVDALGHVLEVLRIPTPTSTTRPEEVIAAVVEAASRTTARLQQPPVGIAVSTPAFSEGPEWTQRLCSNVPALDNFPIRGPLVEAFGPSVRWEYDTNAALLAELRFGQARQFERVMYMGIGTGISSAVAIGGELVRHTFATCGNTGHVIVDASGPPCTCGGTGCLEAVTTAWALRRSASELARAGQSEQLAALYAKGCEVDVADIHRAAVDGDGGATRLLATAGRALGVALASLIHIYFPDAIIFGGGVSGAGEFLLGPARVALEQHAAPDCYTRLQAFEQGRLGPDAGVIGLASLFFG
ncbi:MAG: family protein (putative glucokinase) [Acidimicrobiaceae bacterium]|nr:family protein (putative glucokinase) [Acidimicrobiaceae bacterium]